MTHKKSDRIKFVKEAESIILSKGGKLIKDRGFMKEFNIPFPSKINSLTISLYSEKDQNLVYSVFMQYDRDLKKNNFHEVGNVDFVINSFDYFLHNSIKP